MEVDKLAVNPPSHNSRSGASSRHRITARHRRRIDEMPSHRQPYNLYTLSPQRLSAAIPAGTMAFLPTQLCTISNTYIVSVMSVKRP